MRNVFMPKRPNFRVAAYSDPGGGQRLITLAHGDRREKTIALTFDDGPHSTKTLKLLDLLDRYNVKATFFVVGKMADKAPILVREEARRGHTIANHSYSHPNLSLLKPAEVGYEFRACSDSIEEITGARPRYCRPPGGELNARVTRVAADSGMTTVLWTDDPGDYANPGANVILSRTLKYASPGGIILLHDGIQQTLDVLPAIIQNLRKQGYRFVTLDELGDQVLANARPVVASKKVDIAR